MPVQNYEVLNVNTDVTTTRTLLHEAVPITGSIVSGTYGTWPDGGNIKNYSHGMFQSVYDYPYLSSSANHIFDLTIGFDEGSTLSGSDVTQLSKKINNYNQMAQVLLGYTGSDNQVEIFESDLNFADDNNQMRDVFFVNFSRLLAKDQIKIGTFALTLATGSWDNPIEGAYGQGGAETYAIKTLTDASASSNLNGTKNTNGGDYGVLYASNDSNDGGTAYGVVFYQSGLAIISSSVFTGTPDFNSGSAWSSYAISCTGSFVSASITGSCNAFRHRLVNLSFNNTTEINSSIYFCRVPHNKFNYSSNPTYVSGSKIRVKSVASDNPISYITTVGLYNSSNELLAVAKLSEPLRKDPTNEITLRVRLDY